MDTTLIPDILAVFLFLVSLVISVRAFYTYSQSQSHAFSSWAYRWASSR